MITREELERMEKDYVAPFSIKITKTDDSGNIYILKSGKKDFDRLNKLNTDVRRLIFELYKYKT